MSLQFIIGGSGAGKSHTAYRQIIKEALASPEHSFYVIVPEQFTMQTQKTLVEMHPGHGILNIDVLSFQRLAYRVLEETGADTRRILEDTGKSLLLQKIAQDKKAALPYLGGQMHRPGCIDEMKSLISEFMQYAVRDSEMEKISAAIPEGSLLSMKMKDIRTLYEAFRASLGEKYVTAEEVLTALAQALPSSEKLKDCTMLFDGFTGFTPVQLEVLKELLDICGRIRVTVTMDPAETFTTAVRPHQLFFMSHQMIWSLSEMAHDILPPLILHSAGRFEEAPALAFLEKDLFRYKGKTFLDPQQEIQLYSAQNPVKELEEMARRIQNLVRTRGLKYADIAVITGNLEEYASITAHVFSRAGIPCFIDEKHNVWMNPLVELIRSALEMISGNYSYEAVFRFLRCGLTDFSKSETDLLENYVRGLGIRGKSAWSRKWIRSFRGFEPGRVPEADSLRARFTGQISELDACFSGPGRTVREYCTVLYQFLAAQKAQEKLKARELAFAEAQNRAMEKEYAQIYGLVMGLLEKAVEILGDETIKPQSFKELLETGFSGLEIGLIPSTMDQVLVGDMERSRLKNIKALFFLGVNEGNIPKSTGSGGFLSQLDRDFFASQGIELAPDPRQRLAIGKFYLYLNLTKPSCQLCLSWPTTGSDGEILRPAYLIGEILRLFPDAVTCCREEEAESAQLMIERLGMRLAEEEQCLRDPVFLEQFSLFMQDERYRPGLERLLKAHFMTHPPDQIAAATARALYGEISPYSATRLERYCACAFAHFLIYGLQLSERAEYEFRALDMGNVMHQALEKYAQLLRRQGLSWKDAEKEQTQEWSDACVDEVAADYGNTILHSSARNEAITDRAKRILRRAVWFMTQQLKNSTFEPERFEMTFEGGRIDRVDISREENRVLVKVIDYKSGNTSFDLTKIYHGLQLQLTLYLDGALEAERKENPGSEIVPAGIFYCNIKDPLTDWKETDDEAELEKEKQKALKMNGLVQNDPDIVRALDSTLLSIPVSINKDGTISKNSSAASRQQFENLGAYVKEKIRRSLEEIYSGAAQMNPYKMKNTTACDYCPVQGACDFERRIPGCEYHPIPEMNRDELWKKMEA